METFDGDTHLRHGWIGQAIGDRVRRPRARGLISHVCLLGHPAGRADVFRSHTDAKAAIAAAACSRRRKPAAANRNYIPEPRMRRQRLLRVTTSTGAGNFEPSGQRARCRRDRGCVCSGVASPQAGACGYMLPRRSPLCIHCSSALGRRELQETSHLHGGCAKLPRKWISPAS
jgi:hypothetical protein